MSPPRETTSPLAANGTPPRGRDRKAYNDAVALRWEGDCLRDAKRNWHRFEANYENLVAILRPYLRDCWCPDLAGESRNPRGTLTAWLWRCTDNNQNSWIWDFCNHYQRCHLRRGLIIYCKMVIAELTTPQTEDALGLWDNAEDQDLRPLNHGR